MVLASIPMYNNKEMYILKHYKLTISLFPLATQFLAYSIVY